MVRNSMPALCVLLVVSCMGVAKTEAAEQDTVTSRIKDWAEVTYPKTVKLGETCTVRIKVLKVKDGEDVLSVNMMFLKASTDKIGGVLANGGEGRKVKESEEISYDFKVKSKDDVGKVFIVMYFSPDGSWKSRTKTGKTPFFSAE